jgi:acetyl esterase
MPLHPEAAAARRLREAEGTAPLYTLTLAEARAADLADIQAGAGEAEAVGAVWEREIPGPAGEGRRLTIRGYEPAPAAEVSGADARRGNSGHGDVERGRPVLVYFFGGGWTLGDLGTCDGICRALTNAAGCVTISVRYRLAPEHPFPAAVEDCHAAVAWVAQHADELGVDAARLAVGGDSAGGNLAAAVTLLARDGVPTGPAIRHQLLVYPNTDYLADTESLREHDDPLMFNRRSVQWYWGHYLAKPEDGANPLVSPLRAASHADLPPATVITAEYDPLRDEGEAYAHALAEAGVPVEARRFDGMPHGFFAMPGTYTLGREAQAYAAARLAAAFEAPAVGAPGA